MGKKIKHPTHIVTWGLGFQQQAFGITEALRVAADLLKEYNAVTIECIKKSNVPGNAPGAE